ncbi:FAD-dependent monooxygenase [Streptomyces sp. NPDC002888]|uniref:FAD-dependent monooxygenase n=1 Tax=Streptomyces sp. NPDC002888 TaxID=3364668 RepID=UPI0036753C2E
MSIETVDRGGSEAPVLVVGAGPVGSTLALELAHHGVASIVVERSPRASRHPKMDFVNARSMELLRRLGLADAIRELGVPSDHAFNFLWTQGFDEAPVAEWTYPSVDELRDLMARVNDGSMPREPYQRVLGSLLEELGRRRCREHERVDLREGWSFESLTQDEAGVSAQVVETATGRREHVRARYLVGCDGAGSAVGRAAGIPVDELGPRAQHCDVYFRSTDPALHRHGRFFLAVSARGLTLVSRDGSRTWTGTFPLTGDEGPDLDPVAVIRERLGLDFEVDEVLTVAHWEGRLAVARRYAEGSVFLAGDAAHQFFPTGGHGANTGLGDAVDLGWKLAAVLNGWGGPGLPASYEAERRPVALFNREMCFNLLEVWRRFPALHAGGAGRAQLAGFLEHERYQISNIGIHFGHRYDASPVVCHEDGPQPAWEWRRIVPTTWPGGRLPSVRLGDGTELFDLLGRELTLLDASGAGAGKPLADEAAKRGLPLTLVSVDDADVRAVLERDLVLVRPDHHVAWRGDSAPSDCASVLGRISGHRPAVAPHATTPLG